MDTSKFEKWYNNGGEDFQSRDEMNQYIDYKMARNKGMDHDSATEYAQAQAARFAPTPQKNQKESDADRKYRELRESCNRTRTGSSYLRK